MTTGGFLLLVPDKLLFRIMDIVRENDDVLIFRPEKFHEVHLDIFDECSVADVPVGADVKIGQG